MDICILDRPPEKSFSKSLITSVTNEAYNQSRVTEKGRFRRFIRKKARSYLVTDTDLDSDEKGLEDFLDKGGIVYKSAKFLCTCRTDCQSVQIVVSEDQIDSEDPDTWPPNIISRPRMKRSENHKCFTNNDDASVSVD